MNKNTAGFTIVELLVVIVVIGILATITIVSYTGINNRAIASSLQSDLSSAAMQFKLYQVEHSAYPTSIGSNYCPSPADAKYCIKASPGNSFDYVNYTVNNTSNPQTFTLDATNGTTKYRTTNNTSPTLVAALVLPPNTTDNGNGTLTTTIYSDSSDGLLQDGGPFGLTTGTGPIEINDWGDGRYENRGYQKFNISSISGSINNAVYYVYKASGSTPYDINLIVDHIPDYGVLDGSEFYVAPYANNIGTIHTPGSSGYGSVNVTTYINNDKINSRIFSSYCLRLASSPSGYQSYTVNFAESASNKPYLSVTWAS